MLLSTLALTVALQSAPALEQTDDPPKLAPTPTSLLRHAADAAAKMPLDPHEKTRGRLQHRLVESALACGDVALARDVTGEIENWRRAFGLAAIAAHLAGEGDEAAARTALEKAERAEAGLTEEFVQGWRRDRVRARIARTYALLGDPRTAASIQARLEPSEAGRLASLSTRFIEKKDAAAQVDTLKSIAEIGDLEQVRHSLLALAAIYGRFPGETELRGEIVTSIRELWNKMPLEPRIDVLEQLVRHDTESGSEASREAAKGYVEEIQAMVTDHRWTQDKDVALRAKVAELRVLTKEEERARASLEEALRLYAETRESIVNIDRSDALRPIAEVYAALGDASTANDIWLRALEESLENPNARPRLEDLVETVISIAESGTRPKATLLAMLVRVEGLLDEPW